MAFSAQKLGGTSSTSSTHEFRLNKESLSTHAPRGGGGKPSTRTACLVSAASSNAPPFCRSGKPSTRRHPQCSLASPSSTPSSVSKLTLQRSSSALRYHRSTSRGIPVVYHTNTKCRATCLTPAPCSFRVLFLQRNPISVSVRNLRSNAKCRAASVEVADPLSPLLDSEPALVTKQATAFASATVANLGPGFDFLGCAVEGLGDHVTAEVREELPQGSLVIESITGDGGRLSLTPSNNCIGIAAIATLELLGVPLGAAAQGGTRPDNCLKGGIALKLEKGLPLGSGLGSSAASAAAAAVAVNALFGSPLSRAQLVEAGLRSEATVSGYHADNIAPALMGGFVLVRSYQPLDLITLSYPTDSDLLFVVVTPAFEAPTKKMRAALPKEISMKSHVANSSQAGALVAAILTGNAQLLGASLASDCIVEPRRAPLIPGMSAVKIAAKAAGAYGCTISGAGPTAVAITDDRAAAAHIAEEMVIAFKEQGKLEATATIAPLNREGAKVL